MSDGKKRKRRGRSLSTTPSESQQRILDFIRSYSTKHGYSPSIEDIAIGVDRVRGSVREQLQRLERMGYITRQPRIARSLMLTAKGDERQSSSARSDRRSAVVRDVTVASTEESRFGPAARAVRIELDQLRDIIAEVENRGGREITLGDLLNRIGIADDAAQGAITQRPERR